MRPVKKVACYMIYAASEKRRCQYGSGSECHGD